MYDFLQLCFSPINIVFTILMGGVFLYWTMFLVGAVGLDLFDIDVDTDLDWDADIDIHADVDVDVDVDADVDAPHAGSAHSGGQGADMHGQGSSWFVSVLRFFNVGDVPLMILVSALVGTMWAVSVLSTHYLNPQQSLLRAILWLVPNLLLSLLLTKAVTSPFRYLFGKANLGIEAPTRIVGKTCIITTSEVTPKFGQARIEQEGAPITLNVRCRADATLSKGDEAVITEHDTDNDTYFVYPFDLEFKS